MKIDRGLRQGCCFSPPAFILVVEILGLKIRQNEQIIGLQMGNLNKKHAQYADDLWAILDKFSDFSGLKINYDKTQMMRLGSLKDGDAKLYTQKPISWSQRIKILGIVYTPRKQETIELNYKEMLVKVKTRINSWQYCALSVMGKILVINMLIIPQLVHPLTCIYDPPPDFYKTFQSIITRFIWDNKTPKFKYNYLIRDYSQGGLKLVDLKSKNDSLKCKWMVKAVKNNHTFWSLYGTKLMGLPIERLVNCNITVKDIKGTMGQKTQSIWLDIWTAWAEYNFRYNIQREEIPSELLWYNSNVRFRQNKPGVIKSFVEAGIFTIKDIFNSTRGNWYTLEEISNKYSIGINFLEYYAFIAAIPQEWKKVMIQDKGESPQTVRPYQTICNKQQITKEIYWTLIKKSQVEDNFKIKMEKILDCNIVNDDWTLAYSYITKSTGIPKLHYFQYKILTGRLSTNNTVAKWNKEVDKYCTFCTSYEETMHHLLWSCKFVQNLWKALFRWLKLALGVQIEYTDKSIILNTFIGQYTDCINTIIMIAKYYIYVTRCYEDKLEFIQLMKKIRVYYTDDKILASTCNKNFKFMTKWDKLTKYLE